MQLRVRSQDSFGISCDDIYKAEKIKFTLATRYIYNDIYGVTKISIFKDKTQINREGKIKSIQIFKADEYTNFTYQTDYLNKKFKIFTKSIKLKKNSVEIVYSIFDNTIFINELTLDIDEIKQY